MQDQKIQKMNKGPNLNQSIRRAYYLLVIMNMSRRFEDAYNACIVHVVSLEQLEIC
jgi:hypothetical protein